MAGNALTGASLAVLVHGKTTSPSVVPGETQKLMLPNPDEVEVC